jgi:signal transduction histidine kinase
MGARNCLVCGREVGGGGYLCEKCDKPKKAGAQPQVQPHTSQSLALDPFPAAPVVKFPVEATTPAITSVVDLLVATGVPAILLGADRAVKFVSDAALRLFDTSQSELTSLAKIESSTGIHLGDLAVPASSSTRVRGRNVVYSLVPMSGGAGGAVLIFRDADPLSEGQASFVSYVRETVLGPIKALREALRGGGKSQAPGPLLQDAAATLDQILSSLEMAPGVDQGQSGARPRPRVTEVVRRVADRFVPVAELKGIQLQVDVQDLDERFINHEGLTDALAILMDNALHYVPAAGMVVIGVRWMEHKNKPILLFFVMDNGPLVPEHLRQAIFEPSFTWNPAGERTGRGLFKVREFAVKHGGSVWVESKTGKACTFFLRVRPDGALAE